MSVPRQTKIDSGLHVIHTDIFRQRWQKASSMTHTVVGDAGEFTALFPQETGKAKGLQPEAYALFCPMVGGALNTRDGLKNCLVELWTKTRVHIWPSCCDGWDTPQSVICKQQEGNSQSLIFFSLLDFLLHWWLHVQDREHKHVYGGRLQSRSCPSPCCALPSLVKCCHVLRPGGNVVTHICVLYHSLLHCQPTFIWQLWS